MKKKVFRERYAEEAKIVENASKIIEDAPMQVTEKEEVKEEPKKRGRKKSDKSDK